MSKSFNNLRRAQEAKAPVQEDPKVATPETPKAPDAGITETQARAAVRRYRATKYPITDPSGMHVPLNRSVKIEALSSYLQCQLKAGLIIESDD